MKRYDLIVVGAGPAGLSGAIEAARYGMKVAVFDENARPGGQLFKQIHKFFGSKEHKAKIRGFHIGEQLLQEADEAGVEVFLNATVIGVFPQKEVAVQMDGGVRHFRGNSILVATGAAENAVLFDGWTKPGVIGAGAAQTMMNLHGVRPGQRVLMLGTGNVGLVVGFQLLQAGCELVALADAAPRVGGYGVHAAKLARTGVPFYLSHTIKCAEGRDHVTGVTIHEIDSSFRPIPGTEKHFDVDTICLAVGLTPMTQLCKMAGCEMKNDLPVVDAYGETSVPGLFAEGDVSCIEEASSAMIEGRMGGVTAAYRCGFLEEADWKLRADQLETDLGTLRQGMFAPQNRGRIIEKTDEGIAISENLLKHGYLADDEVESFPGVTRRAGVHPVIECTQNIPCNPCQDSCPKEVIKVGTNITALPALDENAACIGCGMCVASCSGQAIFLMEEHPEEKTADITLPYEFLPLPEKGERGYALDRSGQILCDTEIVGVKRSRAFDGTTLLTMRVPAEMAMKARFFRGV